MTIALAPLCADGAVLPCEQLAPVWGTAPAQSSLTVKLDGAVVATGDSDADGHFRVELPAQPPGGPHQLQVEAAGAVSVASVYFGDLWICSGQSNMQWTLAQTADGSRHAWQAQDPALRYCELVTDYGGGVQESCQGTWRPAVREQALQTSAVGFHFARELRQSTGRPIGLLVNAIGGTGIEAWIPEAEVLATEAGRQRREDWHGRRQREVEPAVKNWSQALSDWHGEALAAGDAVVRRLPDLGVGFNPGNQIAACYDSRLYPLRQLPIKGVIWYQGETNTDVPEAYAALQELLVQSWRRLFNNDSLPFFIVQLAGFSSEQERGYGSSIPALASNYPLLRLAQEQILNLPHTGMACAIDCGNRYDIHPHAKDVVGKRLADLALNRVYAIPRCDEGPRLQAVRRDGDCLRMQYVRTETLVTSDGQEPTGFQVKGADGQWQTLPVRLDEGTVVANWSASAQEVAYACCGYQDVNLMNLAGQAAWPALCRVDD